MISKGYGVSKEQNLIFFLMQLYETQFVTKVMDFRILEYWNFL